MKFERFEGFERLRFGKQQKEKKKMGSIKKKRRKKMSKHKYDKRMKAQRHKTK